MVVSYGELGLEVCLATDFELRGWKPSGISRNLVSTLSFSGYAVEVVDAARRGQ